tara:strand:- start:20 stop:541 length:522 start_codon:yes stop_codon:yes gene_type:complete
MAGSLIKIDEEIVSSAVSSVSLTGIDSTYDVYMVVYNNLKVSADGTVKIRMRFEESGTPNTTANYDRASKFLRTTVGFGDLSDTNETSFNTDANIGNATGEHQNKVFYIFNANNSSEYTFMTEEATQVASSGELSGQQGGGVFTVTSAVDGVNFFTSAGNINSAVFTLYGLKK